MNVGMWECGNGENVMNVENECGNVEVWRMKMPDMPIVSLNKRVLLPKATYARLFHLSTNGP
jgi:hypothetical protein